ncbi:ABC transporter permease [Maledivibacter halophilus]|uniref:Iron(III) transport system permease protein n=1 Tax=Maledivibacter halophilus TaxID=36842 RepID=A0A1T5MA40_9FIRM|nr:iron ABC transporter permease [Maledivibacter halophilus]SKC84864.1 iron(III) transport system permease protein [Maledivibacter halophilus]
MKKRDIKHNINIWSILSFIFICLIILPNVNILINLLNKPNENWTHIKTYLLKDYIINSMILVVFTGVFTTIIGIGLSWIILAYNFPARKFFKWALILPLAIPPYIAAYTYNGILDYTGVVQTTLRNYFNISVNQKYLDIMSIQGSIFIFTMFLFPYVYIITKSFLEKQSAALVENARLLGRNQLEIFIHVVLPISRVPIIGGVSLVILEVLNDYGVVKYFGIPTFSTAIFKTWFGMGDIDSAIRLSAILLFIVFAILMAEKILRGRKKFSFTNTKFRPIQRQRLNGGKGALAFMFCFTVFSLGFLIPTLQLAHWSVMTYEKILDIQFWSFTFSSLSIAIISAGLITIIGTIIANYCRLNDGFISKIYTKTTTVGYSIPGAVIAIAVIVFFIALDKKLFWIYRLLDENSGKLILSTSIVMLIFAYVIRFLAIGFNSIEAGFEKVGKKFSEASRTLGMSMTETFLKVDFKMVKPGILSGFLLVFVDILKELPLTLILRPFNFNTLATKSFEYANDEMIHEASVSSLIIIIISIISIYIFYKASEKEAN